MYSWRAVLSGSSPFIKFSWGWDDNWQDLPTWTSLCLVQHTVVDALFLEEKLFDFVTYVENDYSFQLLLVGILIINLIIEKPQVLFNRERKIQSRCQHITSSSMALFRCYFTPLFWFRFPCLYPTTKRRGTEVPIPRDHHFTYICTTYNVDCPCSCPPIQHSPKPGIANKWPCWLKIYDPRIVGCSWFDCLFQDQYFKFEFTKFG